MMVSDRSFPGRPVAKLQLAAGLIERAATWNVVRAPGLGNDAYDKNTELRARLQDAQIEYVLSLNSDASVYDADTVFEVPERRAASRGRAERAGRRPTGPASLRSHRWTRGGAVSDARVPWPRRARAVRPQQARARVGRADDEAPRRRRSA